MKSTLLLLTFSCMTGALITSCKTPTQRVEGSRDNVEAAQEHVAVANEELEQANEAYMADMKAYRLITAEKIEANEASIATLNTRKQDAKADYNTKVAELEMKNRELKMRMDTYQVSDQDKWAAFKAAFNRDIDALGESLKDLTSKNVD